MINNDSDIFKNRLFNSLLGNFALLFITFYIFLARFSRTASDEWFFISLIREYGWFDSINVIAGFDSPRYAARCLTHLALSNGFISACTFYIVNLFAFIGAMYYSLSVLSKKLEVEFSKMTRFLLSIFIIGGYFFISPSIGEIWFWLAGVPTYLTALVAGVTLFALLFDDIRVSIKIFLVILLTVYIGNASEMFAIMMWLILLVPFIFLMTKSSFQFSKSMWIWALTMDLIFIWILISFFSEGNSQRQTDLGSHSVLNAFYYGFRFAGKILWVDILGNVHFWLAFLLPFILLGNIRKELVMKYLSLKRLLKILFFVLCIISIVSMIQVYLLKSFPPYRATTAIWFIIFIMGILFSIYLGSKLKATINSKLIALSMVIPIVLTIFLSWREIPIAAKYAQSFDCRVERILSGQKDSNKVIKLIPLTDSGLLMSGEITSDSNNVLNRHFAKMLGVEKGLEVTP